MSAEGHDWRSVIARTKIRNRFVEDCGAVSRKVLGVVDRRVVDPLMMGFNWNTTRLLEKVLMSPMPVNSGDSVTIGYDQEGNPLTLTPSATIADVARAKGVSSTAIKKTLRNMGVRRKKAEALGPALHLIMKRLYVSTAKAVQWGPLPATVLLREWSGSIVNGYLSQGAWRRILRKQSPDGAMQPLDSILESAGITTTPKEYNVEALKKVIDGAKQNVQDVRKFPNMEVGQVVRQGDIYISRVDPSHNRGKVVGQQLAMGNTKGSRHIAQAPAKCYEGKQSPSWIDSNQPLGPLVVSEETFTVTHPEHADCELPAGAYQINHQLDARTLRRVQD